MRIALATTFIFINVFVFSQNKSNINPKVLEYSKMVDEYKKTGQLTTKMSNLANEINCMLTQEQAKSVLPFFVQNNMRGFSCGSNEYPAKAILNNESVNKYKAAIKRLESN